MVSGGLYVSVDIVPYATNTQTNTHAYNKQIAYVKTNQE